MGAVDKKLGELGIALPTPAAPVANYVPFVRTGSLLVVSGQLCFDNAGKLVAKGQLGGFIKSAPGFTDAAKVMNGASDVMVEVFGDIGRHARSTVGVSSLPLDPAVEVEAMFEVG